MNDEEWFSEFTNHKPSFIEDVSGVIKLGLEKIEDTVETVVEKGAEILEPVVKPVDEFFGITKGKVVGGKQMPSQLERMQSLGEASYDVPYQIAKDLGAPEGVAVAAGIGVSLLEPSPIGEAKAATVAGELLSKAKPIKAAVSSVQGPLQPQLVGVGAGVSFDGAQAARTNLSNINPITVDPRLRAPGMVEGVAKKYRGDLDARTAKLAEIAERQAAAVSSSAKRRTKVQEVRARSTGPSIKGDDPVAYGRRRYLADDPLDPGSKMDQHHLFTKAQSAPFIKKMDELIAKGIADEDDLVNMFAWAEKLDATMGDRLSNLLNSPRIAHVGEAASIHPQLRRAGLEIRPKLIEGMVSEAKNATELMDLFNNFIITNVKPSQKLAKEITENYLANKKSFTKVEQTAMEDFLAQLRKRGS